MNIYYIFLSCVQFSVMPFVSRVDQLVLELNYWGLRNSTILDDKSLTSYKVQLFVLWRFDFLLELVLFFLVDICRENKAIIYAIYSTCPAFCEGPDTSDTQLCQRNCRKQSTQC